MSATMKNIPNTRLPKSRLPARELSVQDPHDLQGTTLPSPKKPAIENRPVREVTRMRHTARPR